MTYSVYQHWDPLRVCIVGRSYSPEFYSFIKNSKARSVMERIARETEEDYQKLITLLDFFGVEVLRPTLHDDYKEYMINGVIKPPPMMPCDHSIMIGDVFYNNWDSELEIYNNIKANDWPQVRTLEDFNRIADYQKQEVYDACKNNNFKFEYSNIIKKIENNGNTVVVRPIDSTNNINRAAVTRIGKDLYFGTDEGQSNNIEELKNKYSQFFTDYRCHIVDTQGHSDGVYCPVVPGLIVSLYDVPTYKDTFPGWEVIYLPNQKWDVNGSFSKLKEKNQGKWWVPGEELNDDFTNFVEEWVGHWVGYVEETVFDVNMLVIDRHNVVCNNYNKEVFAAFERHGITPHIINFRHRYFWDGGLHCITSDIHREGTMQDYFPERG